MTNFEKLVKDKEFNTLIERNRIFCAIFEKRNGHDCCNGHCIYCEKESFEWLQQEYKPPLLENGDELKTGDWIMIKDLHDDKWIKRKFLAYVDNLFWCYNDGSNCMGSGWQQARLPEEGE